VLFVATFALPSPAAGETASGNVAACGVCHPSADGSSNTPVLTGSAACLSCHDGSVAAGVFNHGGGSVDLQTASMNHPVGIDYRLAASQGSDLRDEHSPASASRVAPGELLVDGRVECSSCYDYHHNGGYGANLRVSNSGSSLCLTCHDK
jgi:hypothetical protein